MNNLVSVIIPVFNAENYLEKTLNSVLNQTYRSLEIICVDNNSEDKSMDIINYYIQNYSNITAYTEDRQGAPYARNRGLSKANGRYIQFLDSDDYLVPEKIQDQILIFQSKPELGFITAENYIIKSKNLNEHRQRDFTETWDGLITGAIGITSSALFKRSVLLDVNGFDTSLSSNQEKDLYFRLLKSGVGHHHSKEPVFYKNENLYSISNQTNNKDKLVNKLNFLARINQFFIKKGISDRNQLLNKYYVIYLENICEELLNFKNHDSNKILSSLLPFRSNWTGIDLKKRLILRFGGVETYFKLYKLQRLKKL